MEDKPFNTFQETHLNNTYVNKTTFYDYQKKQDERMDKHDIEFAKVLQLFKIMQWTMTAICIPFVFFLLRILIP